MVLTSPQISNKNRVQIRARFSNTSQINPCSFYNCTLSTKRTTSDVTSPNHTDPFEHIWYVSPSQDGDYVVVLTVDTPKLCKDFEFSTSFVSDTVSPMAYAVMNVPATRTNSTFVIAITFSETIEPLHPQAFTTDPASSVLRVTTIYQSNRTHVAVQGSPGHTSTLILPSINYQDIAGNRGWADIEVEISIPVGLAVAATVKKTQTPMAVVVTTGIVASAASSAPAVVSTAAASGGSGIKSNILRSSMHLQFLVMTGSLSVPALSPAYTHLANTFSWTTMAFGSQIPTETRAGSPFPKSLVTNAPFLKHAKVQRSHSTTGPKIFRYCRRPE